jgi:hypothetical protein
MHGSLAPVPTLLLALRADRSAARAERARLHQRLRTWWAAAGVEVVPGAIVTVLAADQDQRPRRGGDDPDVAPAVDAVVIVVWMGGAGDPGSRGDDPNEASDGSSISGAGDATPIPDEAVAAAVARAERWGAAEVGAWWADTYPRLGSVRAGAVGVAAPGVEQVALLVRADGLDHDSFVDHWTQRHTPLALRHHVGSSGYVQHVVTAPVDLGLGPGPGMDLGLGPDPDPGMDLGPDLAPGRRDGGSTGWSGADLDGVAELRFASWADFTERFYDSPEGAAVIAADVVGFLSLRRTSAALVTPTVVLDHATSTPRA